MLTQFAKSLRHTFYFPGTPTKPRLQRRLPPYISRVKGFRIAVTRERGCILFEQGTGAELGVDEHFKIQVYCDGSNPHYPKATGAKTALLTNTLTSNMGEGTVGGTAYFHPSTLIEKVEITEKYEDWRNADVIGRMPSPQYVVWLSITPRHLNSRGYITGSKSEIVSRPAPRNR